MILNLAVWFSLHTLFARVDERALGRSALQRAGLASLDVAAAAIAAAAPWSRRCASTSACCRCSAACALAGVAWRLLGPGA